MRYKIFARLILAALTFLPFFSRVHGAEVASTAEGKASRLEEPVRFEMVPEKKSDWEFIIEPYVWSLGMQATVGVQGYDTPLDFSPTEILLHLNWAVFGRAEIRKGKWGVLGDGFFAQLSDSGDLPAPIYESSELTVQQGLAQLALAYRVLEGRLGYLDVYAGARYNYIGIDVSLDPDDDGIQAVSEAIVGRVTDEIGSRAAAFLRENGAAIASEVAQKVGQALTPKVLEAAAKIPPYIPKSVIRATVKEVSAVVLAQAQVKAAELSGKVPNALRQQLTKAEKKLANALAKQIENRVPTSYSGSDWWIDPIVGLRGQINITRWLHLAAQADVGGFGVGSEIAWNLTATIGINFTRHFFSEVGYRAFYMDYDQSIITYAGWESGIFAGVGVRF